MCLFIVSFYYKMESFSSSIFALKPVFLWYLETDRPFERFQQWRSQGATEKDGWTSEAVKQLSKAVSCKPHWRIRTRTLMTLSNPVHMIISIHKWRFEIPTNTCLKSTEVQIVFRIFNRRKKIHFLRPLKCLSLYVLLKYFFSEYFLFLVDHIPQRSIVDWKKCRNAQITSTEIAYCFLDHYILTNMWTWTVQSRAVYCLQNMWSACFMNLNLLSMYNQT